MSDAISENKKPTVQNEGRPQYLSFEEKLAYLEDAGVVIKDKRNRTLINNMYNAVLTMNYNPELRTSTVAANSETTIVMINKARQVDQAMGSITSVMRGFDSPIRGKYSSPEKCMEAIIDHKHFEEKFKEAVKHFDDIIKEIREKGYGYSKKNKNKKPEEVKPEAETIIQNSETNEVKKVDATVSKKSSK